MTQAPPEWLPESLAARTSTHGSYASWLEARGQGDYPIGGTTAAALLGLSPWAGPWDVWAGHHAAPGYQRPGVDKVSTGAGQLWEPFVASAYAAVTESQVWTPHALTEHPALSWARGSVDGFVYDGTEVGLLEIKCPRFRDHWATHGEVQETAQDAPVAPPNYLAQVYWYLACTGLPWCDLCAFFGPHDMRVIRVQADPAHQKAMIRAVAGKRLALLVNGKEPDLDASEACKRALQARPRHEGEELTEDVREAALALFAARQARKDAKAAEDLAKNQLLSAMTADTYTVDGKRALWLKSGRLYPTKPSGLLTGE